MLQRLVGAVVDALPAFLFRPGNLFFRRLHFCVSSRRQGAGPVQMVEWNGRPVARGQRALAGHRKWRYAVVAGAVALVLAAPFF